jgi:hypothetical protein
VIILTTTKKFIFSIEEIKIPNDAILNDYDDEKEVL